jgi:hypothetical protein
VLRSLSSPVGLALTLLIALTSAGCPAETDDDDDFDAAIPRYIPASDPDFADLELPEEHDECTRDEDCEHSCVHSCIPASALPITCPADPPPVPERLIDAECLCVRELDRKCAWVEP